MKKLVKKLLAALGFELRRTATAVGGGKYFNTGKLTPEEENSIDLYDSFYSDSEVLENYYGPDRIIFYKELVRILKNVRVNLDEKKVADELGEFKCPD
jgi:hypothetical protein